MPLRYYIEKLNVGCHFHFHRQTVNDLLITYDGDRRSEFALNPVVDGIGYVEFSMTRGERESCELQWFPEPSVCNVLWLMPDRKMNYLESWKRLKSSGLDKYGSVYLGQLQTSSTNRKPRWKEFACVGVKLWPKRWRVNALQGSATKFFVHSSYSIP